MSNVTLSIEEDDLKQARIQALQNGTSLNAVIRDFVKQYINRDTHYQQLTVRLLKHTENVNEHEGARDWTREELYDR